MPVIQYWIHWFAPGEKEQSRACTGGTLQCDLQEFEKLIQSQVLDYYESNNYDIVRPIEAWEQCLECKGGGRRLKCRSPKKHSRFHSDSCYKPCKGCKGTGKDTKR